MQVKWMEVTLNRLKPLTEEKNTEEQAGFRSKRSTTERLYNLRELCEKYSQNQHNVYHVFMYLKKQIDGVW